MVDAEVAENGGSEYEREAALQIRASDAIFEQGGFVRRRHRSDLSWRLRTRKAFATTKDGDCDFSGMMMWQ